MTQAPEYRLVPVEPTEAMIAATRRAESFAEAWAAALAAAPLPAAPAADRAVSERPLYLWEHDSLTSRVASVEDAKSFTDGNPRWVRAYPVELFTAPPADRAELAEAREAMLQAISDAESLGHPLCGPMARVAARESRNEALAAIDALARSTDAPSREHEAWVPFLSDRADGVRGRFALRRFDERGTAWHWNRKRSEWNAFSDEPMTHDEATALLKSMRPATPPAPATSTPCASGEGLVLAPDKARHIANKARSMTAPCDTTGPTEYVLAGWNAALAATQAPAVPATDAHAAFKWHAVDGKQHDTGRVTRGERGSYFATTASPEDARLIAEALNARTPTAGNTEDARSMGAVSDTQMLDFLARLGDFSAGSVPSIPHDYEVRTEDDRVFKGESLRGCIRAALTQAPSTRADNQTQTKD